MAFRLDAIVIRQLGEIQMDEKFELTTEVATPEGEKKLSILYSQDVLIFTIDGICLFEGDWDANFKEVFFRFMELFGKDV